MSFVERWNSVNDSIDVLRDKFTGVKKAMVLSIIHCGAANSLDEYVAGGKYFFAVDRRR